MRIPLILAAATLAASAHAACLGDAEVAALAEAIAAKTPAATPEGLSDADASCTRAKLNRLLGLRATVPWPATRRG